jgi:hypothetical protein
MRSERSASAIYFLRVGGQRRTGLVVERRKKLDSGVTLALCRRE